MIKPSTVQRGVGWFAVSCDVGYPVNSLSKRFKVNEGKFILLTMHNYIPVPSLLAAAEYQRGEQM